MPCKGTHHVDSGHGLLYTCISITIETYSTQMRRFVYFHMTFHDIMLKYAKKIIFKNIYFLLATTNLKAITS